MLEPFLLFNVSGIREDKLPMYAFALRSTRICTVRVSACFAWSRVRTLFVHDLGRFLFGSVRSAQASINLPTLGCSSIAGGGTTRSRWTVACGTGQKGTGAASGRTSWWPVRLEPQRPLPINWHSIWTSRWRRCTAGMASGWRANRSRCNALFRLFVCCLQARALGASSRGLGRRQRIMVLAC